MVPSDSGNVKPGCKPPVVTATAAALLASAAIFSFSSSASWSRLALARRFWNQILTWVSVRVREVENSARSAMERYCFCRNFLSRARSCEVVKGVRGFRLVLCFLRGQVGLRWPETTQRMWITNNSFKTDHFRTFTWQIYSLIDSPQNRLKHWIIY